MQANDKDLEALTQVILRFLRSTSRGMSSRFDTTRFGTLEIVRRGGPMRLSEVAIELDVNPSSVTRGVHELMAAGLVAQVGNPDDRRSSLISLTPEGEREWQRLHDGGLAAMAFVLGDWGAEDVRTLTALLYRLMEAWERAPPGDLSGQGR